MGGIAGLMRGLRPMMRAMCSLHVKSEKHRLLRLNDCWAEIPGDFKCRFPWFITHQWEIYFRFSMQVSLVWDIIGWQGSRSVRLPRSLVSLVRVSTLHPPISDRALRFRRSARHRGTRTRVVHLSHPRTTHVRRDLLFSRWVCPKLFASPLAG